MNRRSPCPSERLPWPQRLLLVSLGGGLLTLLIVAAVLEPDPRGWGTHQRLGLPPCTFQQWTGHRCPSCGMTTAWANLVRGRVIRAVQANSAGVAWGLASLWLTPWTLVSGLCGRWWWRPLDERFALGLVVVLGAVTLLDWTIRLALGC